MADALTYSSRRKACLLVLGRRFPMPYRSLANCGTRFAMLFLLVVLAAKPCSVSYPRALWAKTPGSRSKLFAFERDGRVGYIDPTGKIVIKPTIRESIDSAHDFSDGLALVPDGYIDENGNLVIKTDYLQSLPYSDGLAERSDFSDGLALVMAYGSIRKYAWEYLYLDRAGDIVARGGDRRSGNFAEGLAEYEAPGEPAVRSFQPGNFQYIDYPGLEGFIDKTGKIVIPARFAEVGPFVTGLARAVLDGYCHKVMPDGLWEGTPTTGYPTSCGGAPKDATTICAVGFINRSGTFVIQPEFESARDFQEDLAAVRIGGKWGFINTTGSIAIPPQFEEAQSFQEGLAGVKIGDNWGFVDRMGKIVIRPQFEKVIGFSDSFAIVYSGGTPSYIDRQGHKKIDKSFKEVTPFVHGLAAVLLDDRHVAYINKSGKHVFDYYRSPLRSQF